MDGTMQVGGSPSGAHNAQSHPAQGINFTVKYAFGCQPTRSDSLISFSASSGNKDYTDRLLHKVGKQVCIYDPETGNQDFFENRPKNVTDVVHFNISSNQRFVCMCENIRQEKASNDAGSQVSVYSLSTFNRLKTLHHSLPRPYVSATFCGDPKLLAALTDEPDRHIVIWQWEKEKLHKTVAVTVSATLLRSAPSTNLMLTTSGHASLKHWCLAPDGSLKHGNLLPTAKESLDIYSDHVWLPSTLGHHRMIALVDPDSSNDINRNRKQSIYVFEGQDTEHFTSNSSAPILPINAELKQTIALKLDPGCRVEKIVPSAKAFMLVGMAGLFAVFERTDDKQEPYVENRRVALGDKHLTGGTVYPSEEKMVLQTKQGRLLTMPLDATIDQIKKTMGGGNDDSESVQSKEEGHRSLVPMDARGSGGISDMRIGGHHTSAILAADMAYERPLIVTIGADATARVWNYITGKCELVHYFRSEEPIAVAFHTSGFQFLVSFKDRVRSYNVLIDKVKPFRETVVKNCKCLKYSHGAQYWAAASAISVTVYETRSFQQLMTFQGHLMTVVKLYWAPGDQILFSAGLDGNVYGWPVAREGRMEVVSANNRSSAILDLVADCNSTVFQVTPKDSEEDPPTQSVAASGKANTTGSAANAKDQQQADAQFAQFHKAIQDINRSWLVISSLDGHMRMPSWSMNDLKAVVNPGHAPVLTVVPNNTQAILNKFYTSIDNMPIIYGDSSVSITAMALSTDRTKLFVGTSLGSLRAYPWPPDPHHLPPYTPVGAAGAAAGHHKGHAEKGHENSHHHLPLTITHATLCAEVFTHSAAVVSICMGPVENTVISTSADGSVFVHTYQEPSSNKDTRAGMPATKATINFDVDGSEDNMQLNNDVVLLALEDIEDHVNEVIELQKLLNETRAKNEFQARKLEVDHNEAIRRVSDMHDQTLTKEKDNFEKQRATFDKRIRELMASIEAKESDHIKVVNELENKYEHKLADQLERYDMLSEKMQLLKQKCEALLEAEKVNFEKQINELKSKYNAEEKRYKLENKRAVEDKIANESALKEIINQQEDEYEDELKQLIQAAETELVSERETIVKLRTLVQTKNTKLDQLKKKLIELQTASKARLVMLNQEKSEKQKLLDTIDHYKKNLIEREDALAEKEKLVLELRSKTRTLENFRFVLDHRLQQLSSERGPITSHIEGLEKHISTMYEELVEEFSNKKAAQEASVLKDQKIQWISQDLNKMRANVREKEQIIAAFKRDLGNIISSMVVGKELEETVKMLYKKFVRGETSNEKGSMKVNAKVSDALNDIMHNNAHGHHNLATNKPGQPAFEFDDQSFLSTETQQKFPGQNITVRAHELQSKSLIRDIEEALVETAKEADRQKKFVERQSENLKHRLHTNQKESHIQIRHRLHENSDLLFENNDLRTENKELNRKLNIFRQQVEELQRSIKDMKKKPEKVVEERPNTPYGPTDLLPPIDGSHALAPNTSSEIAPWVVNNSLPHNNNHLAANSHKPDESKGSAAFASSGKQTANMAIESNIVNSQSAPSLLANHKQHVLNKIQSTSSSILQGAGINILRNNNNAQRDNSSAKACSTAAPKAVTIPQTNKQLEKLNREVENLAVQLDDLSRENALYKLEINRLKKQLLQFQSTHASFGSQSRSLLQPNAGSASNMFVEGEALEDDSNILHADMYGYPSEGDKEKLKVKGLGSNPPSRSQASSASQKQRAPKTMSDSIDADDRKPSRAKASRGEKREQQDGVLTNNLEQFSLEST